MGKTREPPKKCAICRRPALPRTKLCHDCSSALKRARLETAVSQFMPLPMNLSVAGDARLGGHRRHHRSPPGAAIVPNVSRSRAFTRSAVLVALFALVAAAVLIGYFAIDDLNPGGAGLHSADRHGAPRPTETMSPAPPTRGASAPAAAPEQHVTTDGIPAGSPDVAAVMPSVRRPTPAGGGTARRPGPSPSIATPAPIINVPLAAFGPSERTGIAPQPSPAPKPVPEPSPPDRWQAMSDAAAKCAREGLLAGFLCSERVRLHYCNGYWGRVAQCPTGNRNEYGS